MYTITLERQVTLAEICQVLPDLAFSVIIDQNNNKRVVAKLFGYYWFTNIPIGETLAPEYADTGMINGDWAGLVLYFKDTAFDEADAMMGVFNEAGLRCMLMSI